MDLRALSAILTARTSVFNGYLVVFTVVTFGRSNRVEVKSFVVGLCKSRIVPLELRILFLLLLVSVHFILFLKIVVLGLLRYFLWAPASAHGLASVCIMSTEIGRVKGKYAGLKAYLKLFFM